MTPTSLLRVLPAGAQLHHDAAAPAAVALHDVTHDHRTAGPGVLFAARPGRRTDGHDHAAAAVAAGSPALLVERRLDLPVPQVQVPDVAAVLGLVAAAVHGHPSDALTLLGVTGTNGKTTTTYLLDAALRASGALTGLIGTVETRVAGRPEPGARTTPEATDLQRLLARMRDRGVTAAAMEVSSHGLALGRVTGTRFAAAAFSNLTQDHLDFHPDLDAYFAAKASLFTPAFTALAVINIDDRWGARLADQTTARTVRVSAAGRPDADVRATRVRRDRDGSRFVAELGGVRIPVTVHLPGAFNVANALLALATAQAVGIDPAVAAGGIAGMRAVPGRMERVEAGQPFTVLVDYAHTPDSLARALAAVREVAAGRVLVVVGCGGDRDRGKRPVMGRAAAEGADIAFLTSDNPRSEDPDAILAQVAAGARPVAGADVRVVADRRAAIAAAVAAAEDDDVVVIAGKGHETYQELADRVVDFDDRLVARAALEARR